MRSSETPARCAASYEQSISAAPWSTSMLAHMRFGYGKTTMRLSGVTVRISSGEYAVRDHASGLSAATAANVAHSSLTCRWCSSTLRPASARSAVSNSGYTWSARPRRGAPRSR